MKTTYSFKFILPNGFLLVALGIMVALKFTVLPSMSWWLVLWPVWFVLATWTVVIIWALVIAAMFKAMWRK